MTGTTKDSAKKPRSPVKVRPLAEAPAASVAAMSVTTPAVVAVATIAPAAVETAAVAERSPINLTLLPTSSACTLELKENIMATAYGTTTETAADTVKATVSQFNDSAEAAMNTGKDAMEKISAQAKEAAETSMKSIEEMTDLARGNVEAMLASARLAAAGFETLAAHISEVSRKSFESTTAAARAMTSAKTPNEMFQLQSDFAKTQFDQAVSEFSKMTEMMVKLSGEVMEPVQNRMAVATDKMKSAFTK